MRIFAILLFVSSSLYGQELEKIQVLETIEVTATKINTPITESGRSITVLKRKDIADLPVQTIDELLRYIPGVNLNSRMGFGVQTDIGIRGSTFSQVLVLLDNVRINDPLTAHFNNNIPVPLAEIEQVEIIRGPAAASYGADAVGGLIHIKTRTYLQKQIERTTQIDLTGGIGEDDLLLYDGGVYANFDKLILSGSVKASESSGREFANPNFPEPNPNDTTYNNFFDILTVSGALNYQFNEAWNAYARVSVDRRDFAAKYFYTASTFDESTEETNSIFGQVALRRNANNQQTELNLGVKETDDLFIFNPLLTPNEHTTRLLFANLNHQFYLTDQIKLAVGSQYQRRTIESSDRGDHENSSIGGYGILSYPISNQLLSTTSLRLEYDDNFGFEVLPQFSLAYLMNGAVIRASAGRSIRAADFTERYISSLIPELSANRNIGNPDLKAETAWSIDLGVDHDLGPTGLLSATGFYRFSNNLIDFARTNSNEINNQSNLLPDTEYFYTKNISESNTIGLEGSIDKRFSLGEKCDLRAIASATWLKTSNQDSVVSKYLANHPNLSLGLNIVFSTEYFNISSSTSYASRDEEQIESINASIQDNYSTTHIKATVLFPKFGINVFAQVYNVFDEEYQEILGAQMPRRWFLGGLEMKILSGKKQERSSY